MYNFTPKKQHVLSMKCTFKLTMLNVKASETLSFYKDTGLYALDDVYIIQYTYKFY